MFPGPSASNPVVDMRIRQNGDVDGVFSKARVRYRDANLPGGAREPSNPDCARTSAILKLKGIVAKDSRRTINFEADRSLNEWPKRAVLVSHLKNQAGRIGAVAQNLRVIHRDGETVSGGIG